MNDEKDMAILVESLRSCENMDSQTIRNVFGIVRNLLSDNPTNQNYFRELQGIDLMISIYQHFNKLKDTEIVGQALYTLSIAAEQNDVTKEKLLTLEFFTLVKGALKIALGPTSFLLLCLASNNGQDLSRSSHLINKLCMELKEKISAVTNNKDTLVACDAVCATLSAMVSSPVNRQNQDICCRLLFPTLVRSLYQDINSKTLQSILNLIGCSIIDNGSCQKYLCVVGGIRGMATVLSKSLDQENLSNKTFLLSLVTTLSCSYTGNYTNKAQAIELGIIKSVLRCLELSSDAGLKTACVSAMLNLLDGDIDEIGKKKFQDEGGIPQLIDLLTTQDDKLKKLVSLLLHKTFDKQGMTKVRTAIENKQTCDQTEQAEGEDSSRKLESQPNDPQTEVKTMNSKESTHLPDNISSLVENTDDTTQTEQSQESNYNTSERYESDMKDASTHAELPTQTTAVLECEPVICLSHINRKTSALVPIPQTSKDECKHPNPIRKQKLVVNKENTQTAKEDKVMYVKPNLIQKKSLSSTESINTTDLNSKQDKIKEDDISLSCNSLAELELKEKNNTATEKNKTATEAANLSPARVTCRTDRVEVYHATTKPRDDPCSLSIIDVNTPATVPLGTNENHLGIEEHNESKALGNTAFTTSLQNPASPQDILTLEVPFNANKSIEAKRKSRGNMTITAPLPNPSSPQDILTLEEPFHRENKVPHPSKQSLKVKRRSRGRIENTSHERCCCKNMPYVDSHNVLNALKSSNACGYHNSLGEAISAYIKKRKAELAND